jgi:hypothetical protein
MILTVDLSSGLDVTADVTHARIVVRPMYDAVTAFVLALQCHRLAF